MTVTTSGQIINGTAVGAKKGEKIENHMVRVRNNKVKKWETEYMDTRPILLHI